MPNRRNGDIGGLTTGNERAIISEKDRQTVFLTILELVPIGVVCGFSSEIFRDQGRKTQEYLKYFKFF